MSAGNPQRTRTAGGWRFAGPAVACGHALAPAELPGESLRLSALEALAAGEPIDPNDPTTWASADAHATAVLQRHGITRVEAARLDFAAVRALIAGQAQADRDAGLDWTRITTPATRLDDALRRAHARLPIDFDDPRAWAAARDQRRALARRAGLAEHQRDDIADWALRDPKRFAAGDLRSWEIASPSWLALADEQLAAIERVGRPVGLLVVPAALRDGWQLVPILSLDAVRLLAELGGRIERGLRGATLPLDAIDVLLERVNRRTLHAGGRDSLDSGRRLGDELARVLERSCSPGAPKDPRDRWGRLLVSRATHNGGDGTRRGELHLRVLTFAGKGFTQRRLGSAPRDQYPQPSASMDLGEAVQTAVDRGLPLLPPVKRPNTSATRCASGA